MNQDTRRALEALNDRFYRRLAADFSATRQRPWRGWERLLPLLEEGDTVLDVGCGNGRLLKFLRERSPGVRYLGVDRSAAMLDIARVALGGGDDVELAQLDVLDGLTGWLAGRRFALVAMFGLLHHVPGRAERAALVRRLAVLVAPGGALVFAAWRFAEAAEVARKTVPWERVEDTLGTTIDRSQLEPGDLVLGWKEQPDELRYCHAVDDAEILELREASGLEPVAEWLADGRTGEGNRYVHLVRR